VSISNHTSPAFQEYLHELRNICSANEVLPKSYTLSTSLLAVSLPPIPGSVREGTFGGSRVRIQRSMMHPNGDPRTFKMVRFDDTFTHVLILNNLQAFYRMVVVWKNLSHQNVVPLLGVTTDPIQLISGWMPDFDLTGYITAHPNTDRSSLVGDPLTVLCDVLTPSIVI